MSVGDQYSLLVVFFLQEDIIIVDTQVFVDPYEEADEQLKTERNNLTAAIKITKEKEETTSLKRPVEQPKVYKSGVGKYIKPSSVARSSKVTEEQPVLKKHKTVSTTGFTNFDSW